MVSIVSPPCLGESSADSFFRRTSECGDSRQIRPELMAHGDGQNLPGFFSNTETNPVQSRPGWDPFQGLIRDGLSRETKKVSRLNRHTRWNFLRSLFGLDLSLDLWDKLCVKYPASFLNSSFRRRIDHFSWPAVTLRVLLLHGYGAWFLFPGRAQVRVSLRKEVRIEHTENLRSTPSSVIFKIFLPCSVAIGMDIHRTRHVPGAR